MQTLAVPPLEPDETTAKNKQTGDQQKEKTAPNNASIAGDIFRITSSLTCVGMLIN